MNELRRRVAALEKRFPPTGDFVLVRIRRFDRGDATDIEDVRVLRTGNGCTWERAAGETEEEFIARARREAPRPDRGCALVLVA